jgi:putative heme-binding domain-containing protein
MILSARLSARFLPVAFAVGAVLVLAHSPVSATGGQGAEEIILGQKIFDGKGECLSCHRVADHGSYMGPDLSAIGSIRKPEEIRTTVLSPNAEVSLQNRLYRVVANDGRTITGRLLNQDIYTVQMLTSQSQLVTLKKSSLRSFDFKVTPPMPSYQNKLTDAEQADLIAYLISLQGVVKQ